MSCFTTMLHHMQHSCSLYIALLSAVYWSMLLLGLSMFRLNSSVNCYKKQKLCMCMNTCKRYSIWVFCAIFSSILLFVSLTLANCREVLWLLLTSRELKFISNNWPSCIIWLVWNPLRRSSPGITLDNSFMKCTRWTLTDLLCGFCLFTGLMGKVW